MKIVNLKTFLELPPNTLYSKFDLKNYHFDNLEIKGDSWIDSNDFFSLEIASAIEWGSQEEFWNPCEDAVENGTSLKIDLDLDTRDGFFDQDQLFAIWEPNDVNLLIERLKLDGIIGYLAV